MNTLLPLLLGCIIAAVVSTAASPASAEDNELKTQISMELYSACLPGCLADVASRYAGAGQTERNNYCGLVCGCTSASYLNQTTDQELQMMVQRQPPTNAMQTRLRQANSSCQQIARDGLRLRAR